MESNATYLLDGWRVNSAYLFAVLALALIVRLLMSLLRAMERPTGKKYLLTVWMLFRGCGVSRSKKQYLVPDYWHPFFLGIFELLAYPILMKTDNWQFIGAWLTFKTLAQWKAWSKDRVSFNRFLIGNALVLLLSFLILVPLVSDKYELKI